MRELCKPACSFGNNLAAKAPLSQMLFFHGQLLFLCLPGQPRHRYAGQSHHQAQAKPRRPLPPRMALLVCQPCCQGQGNIPLPFSLPCPITAFGPGKAIPMPSLSRPLTHRVASLFPGAPSWQVACSPSIRSIFLSWECTTQGWMSGEGKIWRFHSR